MGSLKTLRLEGPRLHLLILAAVGATRFINLGFEDLQAWDEALYAMRSLAVVRYGAFLDQTRYAVDGLYSSLHPPLYVWLSSLLVGTVGQSEFVFRFWSALLGAATPFIVYALGTRLANHTTGLFAALLFGVSPFVSFFSRQGQFDATLTFFLALSLLLLIRALESENTRYYLYAGFSIGAALMTKLFVGLGIIAAFVLWGIMMRRLKEPRFRSALFLLLLGSSVALPWHVFMTLAHGDGDPLFLLKQSALWERVFHGIEGNIKPTGPFYFVNQMVVLFPLGVAFFVAGLLRMKSEQHQGWLLIYLWFIVVFGVFTLIRTKLAVYTLPMLVPASLIAARELSSFANGILPRAHNWFLLAGTGVSLIWSSSQDIRNAAKQTLLSLFTLTAPEGTILRVSLLLLLWLVMVTTVSFVLLKMKTHVVLVRRFPLIMFVLAMAHLTYIVVFRDPVEYKDGGVEVQNLVEKQNNPAVVVAGFERNPQLTYYLDGADIGWRADIRIRRVLPPLRREEYRAWLHEELFYEPRETILIIEKDKLIRYQVLDPASFVPDDMHLVLETRRYACYQRQPGAFLARAWGD